MSMYLILSEYLQQFLGQRPGRVIERTRRVVYRSTGPNSAVFYMIEPMCWDDIKANMDLYDFFASYGIYPDLVRGYWHVKDLEVFV